MFHTIVVPLDGSLFAEHALPLAVSIARRSRGGLHLARIHVPADGGASTGDWVPDAAVTREEQTYLDATARRIRETAGVPASTTLIDEGSVAPALAAHAAALGADLMVLTTHGRGPLSRFWLGSVTDELLRTATVPLLVYRPEGEAPPALDAERHFRRILVPLDGSEVAEAALDPAAEVARLMGGELTLLRAVEVVPVAAPDGLVYTPPTLDATMLEELVAQARRDLDGVAARLQKAGLVVGTRVAAGEPAAAAVLDAAEEADLVALATRGRSKVARLFLGSVADKVVRGAPCPVLVVRSRPAHTKGGEP
jgi:nucleotide-binding universal stress UspA family protein